MYFYVVTLYFSRISIDYIQQESHTLQILCTATRIEWGSEPEPKLGNKVLNFGSVNKQTVLLLFTLGFMPPSTETTSLTILDRWETFESLQLHQHYIDNDASLASAQKYVELYWPEAVFTVIDPNRETSSKALKDSRGTMTMPTVSFHCTNGHIRWARSRPSARTIERTLAGGGGSIGKRMRPAS